MNDNTQKAFLELAKAGLWETEGRLSSYGEFDFSTILRIATEQGVVGLVAAGLEPVSDVIVPQKVVLQFVGQTLQIEQRNKAMNQFVAELVEKMHSDDINSILIKGQGVAQCYEKPLWRHSVDVDFLLSNANYDKAVNLFKSLYHKSKNGGQYSKEFAFCTDQWMIELHGSLRTGLSASVDRHVDAALNSVFMRGNVRSWQNGTTQVFLPAPTEDVFLVFTHFIKHFYKEGMTLRQVCDWCRLIWTYRTEINVNWLESHLRKAGLMTEWKIFYNLASTYLGMPDLMEVLMTKDSKFDRKAEKLMTFILAGYSGSKIKDTWQIAKIFPWKARYSPSIFLNVNWLKVKERLFNKQI